jgi:adenosyl cobinamide kinase/adenosyl cobinamide phosphate guanylyltransferase
MTSGTVKNNVEYLVWLIDCLSIWWLCQVMSSKKKVWNKQKKKNAGVLTLLNPLFFILYKRALL